MMHFAAAPAENRGQAQSKLPVASQPDVAGRVCCCACACSSMKASQLGQHSALHGGARCTSPASLTIYSCMPRRAARASSGTVLRAAHETKLTAAARCGCALVLAVRSASIPGSETREVGGRKFTIYKVPSPMLCVLAPAACHVQKSSWGLP
jgi:hypothetical protein